MSQGFAKKDFADPGWQDYVPTFTNFTLGNGTIDDARYTQIGTTVHFYVQITLGSTSSMSTGPTISVPVNIASNLDNGYDLLGTVYMVNEGVQAYFGYLRKATTTSVLLIAINETGAVPNTANVTSSVPFTWGSTDRIIIQGTYEAATSALIDLGANDDHGSLSGLTDDDHPQYPVYTDWTTWSPTGDSNLTVGNGTFPLARYTQIGKTVFVHLVFTWGSTTSASGNWGFNWPVTPSSSWASRPVLLGTVRFHDPGVAWYGTGAVVPNGTTSFRFTIPSATGSYVQPVDVVSTVPFTWATGDEVYAVFFYEAA